LTNLTKPDPFWYRVRMGRTLNLYEAKTQLSSLVDEAAAGAEIVIAKNGKPLAKLVPFRAAARHRPGKAKGRIWMSADFDDPLPADVAAAFEGRHE
jgi:prevent-host-death family protein